MASSGSEAEFMIGTSSEWKANPNEVLGTHRYGSPMDRSAAISQIREACKNIALQFMKIHPALPHLQDAETMSDSLKCLHEMTVQMEMIKKKIGKLERTDDSSLL